MTQLPKYKRIFVFILFVVLLTAAFSLLYSLNLKQGRPRAENGTLDLTGWDERSCTPSLAGEWEFYWDQLLTEDDFNQNSALDYEVVNVPATWNSYTVGGEKLPGFGYATYRLKVIVKDPGQTLSLRINTMSTAYKLFIDDQQIASNGIVGTDAASTTPWYQPVTVSFTPPSTEFDTIVQISNFTYARGGFWYEIQLGTPQQITALNDAIIYKDAILIGVLLIMALYYINFFFAIRTEKNSLYFFMLCIVFIVRTSLYGDTMINKVFPSIPFGITVFLTYASLYWIPVVIFLLINSIFPYKARWLKTCFYAYGVTATLFTAFLPISIYTSLITPIEVIGIVIVSLAIFSAARAYVLRQKGAGLIMSGTLLTMVAGIHDVLYQANVVVSPFGELASIGVFIFISTFSLIMANRFADILNESRKLSLQLTDSLQKEKELTDALVAYDKNKDEFLINTSHELKTPLHGMINITEHVKDHLEEDDPGSQREDLGYVITTAKRLASLIDDIIDFQSIKNNSLHLECKRVDVSAPLQLVREVLGKLFTAKRISIVNHVPASRYFVIGDEDRIRQIIYNLVGNALKFTKEGALDIMVEALQDTVIITFADTGIGIEPQRQKNIFDFFEYSGGQLHGQIGSSGLGLPISKKLAEKMGGRLWLKKSAPGAGSVFALALPADQSCPEHDAAEGLPPQPNAGVALQPAVQSLSGRHTVLVVDDDITNLKVITDIFSQEDYNVLTAFNGDQALNILARQPDIALVLLDIMMPGMSGIELCRTIRQDHSLFEVPVLLLTVKNTPEDIAAGLDAGANDYLTKPFDARELRARAKTLIGFKNAVRDLVATEMSFLKAQIKPHFIYNALSVIAAMIEDEPVEAKELLFNLTDYLRGSFHFENYNGLVPLADELETVKAYLAIEKARFRNKLEIEWDVDETISVLVPLLSIQPLVENAVRHGVMKRGTGGKVRLCIRTEDGSVVVEVTDNGVGIEKKRISELLSGQSNQGIGLKNINKRLHLYYGRKLQMESKVGVGTKIIMKIPQRRQTQA